VSHQPHPVIRFEGQKTVSRIQFSARYVGKFGQEIRNWFGEVITLSIWSSGWEVTRKLSCRVTPLLYLVFLLMYLHMIVGYVKIFGILVMYVSKSRQGFTIKLLDYG